MTIDGRTLNAVRTALVSPGTSELNFQTALADVAIELDRLQEILDSEWSVTLEGDISGTMARNAYNTNPALSNGSWTITTEFDTELSTEHLADSAISTAKIADDAITTAKIADDAITNAQVADDAIINTSIAATSKRRLRILDSNGTTVLAQGDLIVPE